MQKDKFNGQSSKILNEYALTLKAHAGVVPLRGSKGSDQQPTYQAELFRKKVTDWLEENNEYQNRNALTTSVLPASADGMPRMSITGTAELLERVKKAFEDQITKTEIIRENVSSKRIIKRPDVNSAPADLSPAPDKIRDDPKARSDFFKKRRGL